MGFAADGGGLSMAEIILITSGKGGTGKTVLTALLGRELARAGRRVLLTDTGNGVCDLGIMLGTQVQTVYDMGDVLGGNCDVRSAVLVCPSQKGLHVLPAPTDPTVQLDMPAFCSVLQGIAQEYDTILIDTRPPAYLREDALLKTASGALVVCTPDPIAVMDSRIATDAIYEAGLRMALVINMVRSDFGGCGPITDLDAVIDGVGAQLIGVLPFDAQLPEYTYAAQASGLFGGAWTGIRNIAARLSGVHVPLMIG